MKSKQQNEISRDTMEIKRSIDYATLQNNFSAIKDILDELDDPDMVQYADGLFCRYGMIETHNRLIKEYPSYVLDMKYLFLTAAAHGRITIIKQLAYDNLTLSASLFSSIDIFNLIDYSIKENHFDVAEYLIDNETACLSTEEPGKPIIGDIVQNALCNAPIQLVKKILEKYGDFIPCTYLPIIVKKFISYPSCDIDELISLFPYIETGFMCKTMFNILLNTNECDKFDIIACVIPCFLDFTISHFHLLHINENNLKMAVYLMDEYTIFNKEQIIAASVVAAETNNIDIINKITEMLDGNDEYALYYAIENRNIDKMLKLNNITFDAADAIIAAIKSKDINILRIVLHQIKPNTLMHDECSIDDFIEDNTVHLSRKMLELLLQFGFNINDVVGFYKYAISIDKYLLIADLDKSEHYHDELKKHVDELKKNAHTAKDIRFLEYVISLGIDIDDGLFMRYSSNVNLAIAKIFVNNGFRITKKHLYDMKSSRAAFDYMLNAYVKEQATKS